MQPHDGTAGRTYIVLVDSKATNSQIWDNFNVEDVIPSLRESGFNLVTLANNHIFDFGIRGISK